MTLARIYLDYEYLKDFTHNRNRSPHPLPVFLTTNVTE